MMTILMICLALCERIDIELRIRIMLAGLDRRFVIDGEEENDESIR